MYVNEKYDCPYVFVCGDLNSRTADTEKQLLQ